MALISGSTTSFTGVNFPKPLLPIPKLTANTSINYPKTHVCFKKTSVTRPLYFVRGGYGAKFVISVGSRNYEPSSHNDGKGPFWLVPSQEFIRALKSVFVFLAEQPSQLKYIEWPGFQNTLKTATLTLVLVAMLIVVLSSVDSGLCKLLQNDRSSNTVYFDHCSSKDTAFLIEVCTKVSWEKGGLNCTAQRLREIFEGFGEVKDVVTRSSKKKESVLIVMGTKEAVVAATGTVCGDLSNPLLVASLQPAGATSFPTAREPVKPDGPQLNEHLVGAGYHAFEDSVLQKLKKASGKHLHLLPGMKVEKEPDGMIYKFIGKLLWIGLAGWESG